MRKGLFSKSRAPLVAGSGSEKALRLLLLVGLFALCGAGFWFHFERRFAEIEAKNSFLDETNTIGEGDREALRQWQTSFTKGFGIRLLVHVRQNDVLLPDLSKNTIFIGVAPQRDQALVVLPPLIKKALQGAEATRTQNVSAPSNPLAANFIEKNVNMIAKSSVSGLEVALHLCLKQHTPYACIDSTLKHIWDTLQ